MMTTAKLIVVLVQVGSNLWVNPNQIIALRMTTNSYQDIKTCIETVSDQCVESDWSVDRITAALEKGQK
jgi:hypothetical protein